MILKIREDLDYYFDSFSVLSIEKKIFAYIDEKGELKFESKLNGKITEVDDSNARLLISDTNREKNSEGTRFECRLLYLKEKDIDEDNIEILSDGEIQLYNNNGIIIETYNSMIEGENT